MWIRCFLIFLAFMPALAQAETAAQHSVTVGKLKRGYTLVVPSKSSPAPRSLVVVLHGGGGSGENIARVTGFSKLAEKENFLVAYPEGTGRVPTWNAGKCCGYAQRMQVDDTGFIEAMIKDIKAKQPVDSQRIYATGMSNGGMMAYRLACDMGSVFAAVAPVAGAMNTFTCAPKGRPSLAIFHALDDKHVLFNGGMPETGLRETLSLKPNPDASVKDAMDFWLKQDYCRKFPGNEDKGDYTVVTYFCAEDRHVTLYMLDTGGHSWPGGQKGRPDADEPIKSLSATEEIWTFFKNHPPREVF